MSFQFLKTRLDIALAGSDWPEADGILLPTNDYLWMAAGPALALKQKAGEEVELEAVRSGPVAVGQVVATKAGSLAYEAILHAAVMGQDLQVSQEAAVSAVRLGVREASKRKWSKLLVHSFLGAGRGIHRELALPVTSGLVEELLEQGSLRQVTLLATDGDERDLLHATLLRIIQGH